MKILQKGKELGPKLKLSFILCFLFPLPLLLPVELLLTITAVEPCALNAEFQDFIPKFSNNFLNFVDTTERGDETEGDFRDNS